MKTHFYNLAVLGSLMLLGPCDESLLPLTEPEVILQGNISGQYVCSVPSGNRMIVYFTVQNIYEETLDDIVQFRGFVELRSARRPDIKKTFTIGPANLITGQSYNRQTGRLTINPKDSLVFSVSWDLTLDDRGVDPRGELFSFYEDPICSLRCLAAKEDFALSGEITVFNNRAPVKASSLFPLCYVSAVIPNNACVAAQTEPACFVQPNPNNAKPCFPFGSPSGSVR